MYSYLDIVQAVMVEGKLFDLYKDVNESDVQRIAVFKQKMISHFDDNVKVVIDMYDDMITKCKFPGVREFAKAVNKVPERYRALLWYYWNSNRDELKLREHMSNLMYTHAISSAKFDRFHWMIGSIKIEDIPAFQFCESRSSLR